MENDTTCKFPDEGLATSGVTVADLKRGFIDETTSDEGRVDADGTNHVGDPYARPGFAGAPSKYQRL